VSPVSSEVVDLPAGTRVIADLHLHPDVPAPWERLERFLAAHRGLPALVVLGDLFEYWIGPAQMREPGGARAVELLRGTHAAGTALHLVHGNRDFLLEERFAAATGVRLWPAGFVARLPDGARLLCLHGDELATLDRAYQRLRRVLRCRPMRAVARVLPAAAARTIARRLRRRSSAAVAAKPDAALTLQLDEARSLAALRGCEHLVCGHAHRFRQESLPGGTWTVLDAFGGPKDVARVEARGLVFESAGPS
jgi:UDP-2,3-diacylglucosamine hydrolase